MIQVIHKTFEPLLQRGQSVPRDLASALLKRFSSHEGYSTEQNLVSAIKRLKSTNVRNRFNEIVIGVITNSDDRVPAVLSSFGLNICNFRYGKSVESSDICNNDFHIDFNCISYDVGWEKPNRHIFQAAATMHSHIVTMRYGHMTAENISKAQTWTKVYVGDEYEKDVVGAMNADWNPIFLSADPALADVANLDSCYGKTIAEAFKQNTVVRAESILELVSWLCGE